jgi:4-hydroxythreonine-4-phosphate dehydrogenase
MKIIIPLGDPAGIGTEVVLKALARLDAATIDSICLVGNRELLAARYRYLRDICDLPPAVTYPLCDPDRVETIEVPLEKDVLDNIELSRENAAGGEASFRYLDRAIDIALNTPNSAIVTAPISKYAWLQAGHNYPGQTEFLAEKAGVSKFGMMFLARSPHSNWTLRALLATTHIPLQEVPKQLTPDLLDLKLDLFCDWLEKYGNLPQGTIAIAGLNPHSGEGGKLGSEEVVWMNDWLERARKRHDRYNLRGLLPPDTMWIPAADAWFDRGEATEVPDAYFALYHDQGLIPVKLMAFDRAVNTTIGLPFLRTSPDHGTAFDIAKRGIANPNSMSAAISLALAI